MSFASLKRSSGKSFDKINKELEKLNQKSWGSDADEYWKPTVDSAGNGMAIIRFLPPKNEEDLPWVMIFDHWFQGPGGYYVENSLTTLGKDDPVSEYNSKLWNSTTDDDSPARKQARDQKRRQNYYSNIYVVKDPGNPDNEGKVFKYKYGSTIFNMIKDVMHPEFDDEDPMNPFDFWTGANFKMKIRNVAGWRNYDKSEFDTPGPLSDDDEELEEIYNKMYDIQALVAPDQFKSYDELKAKLFKVLGENELPAQTKDELEEEQTPWKEEKSEAAKAPSKSFETADVDDDSDDDLEFFKNFASDD